MSSSAQLTRAVPANIDDFAGMDHDEIRETIRDLLRIHNSSLVDLAKAVAVAHGRRVDLTGIIHARYLDGLLRIASGNLIPSFVKNYLETPAWPQLKSLSVELQEATVRSGRIAVVVRRGDKFDTRNLDVNAMTPAQARLAIDRGRLRSESEMITILESEVQDVPDEAVEEDVCVSIPKIDLFVKKSQKKRLAELKEKAGSMQDFVRKLILDKLS